MTRVLVTAFEPYGEWTSNASWLALVELTRSLPERPQITTRLYPVDFERLAQRLAADLEGEYDYALHVGQCPGSTGVQLEAVGLNLARERVTEQTAEPPAARPLIAGGPAAYFSPLPLEQYAVELRNAGIPARVSFHAGTYLCNATLYLSQHLAQERGYPTRSTFVHVPLEPSQVAASRQDLPCLSASCSAAALRVLLSQFDGEPA